jgi:hypothetical protein
MLLGHAFVSYHDVSWVVVFEGCKEVYQVVYYWPTPSSKYMLGVVVGVINECPWDKATHQF